MPEGSPGWQQVGDETPRPGVFMVESIISRQWAGQSAVGSRQWAVGVGSRQSPVSVSSQPSNATIGIHADSVVRDSDASAWARRLRHLEEHGIGPAPGGLPTWRRRSASTSRTSTACRAASTTRRSWRRASASLTTTTTATSTSTSRRGTCWEQRACRGTATDCSETIPSRTPTAPHDPVHGCHPRADRPAVVWHGPRRAIQQRRVRGLFRTGLSGAVLLRNNGDGTFTDVTGRRRRRRVAGRLGDVLRLRP
jgi:hypothetical protein